MQNLPAAPRISRYSNVELLLWPEAEVGLVLKTGTGEVLRGYTGLLQVDRIAQQTAQ